MASDAGRSDALPAPGTALAGSWKERGTFGSCLNIDHSIFLLKPKSIDSPAGLQPQCFVECFPGDGRRLREL